MVLDKMTLSRSHYQGLPPTLQGEWNINVLGQEGFERMREIVGTIMHGCGQHARTESDHPLKLKVHYSKLEACATPVCLCVSTTIMDRCMDLAHIRDRKDVRVVQHFDSTAVNAAGSAQPPRTKTQTCTTKQARADHRPHNIAVNGGYMRSTTSNNDCPIPAFVVQPTVEFILSFFPAA